MKKAVLAVIVLAHLFTASCGYQLINNDDDGELDIILSLNAPNDDIVLVDYAFIHGLDGYADAYIKEGEQVPTFTETDTLEAIYYISQADYYINYEASDSEKNMSIGNPNL